MADIVSFGSDRPPRRPPRWLVAGVVVLVAAGAGAAAVFAFGDHDGPDRVAPTVTRSAAASGVPCRSTASPAGPMVDTPAGLLIDGARDQGFGLERRDCSAADGPRTVVVRRATGSLGRHGAVVTFPAAAPAGGHRVDVGGVPGTAKAGIVTWPIAGGYAQIRGDLTQPELLVIGASTRAVDGRPAVSPPAGYAVAASGPYRPPSIHEVRYGSTELGEQAALGGGLTYTGVLRGGGFEDQLYAVPTRDGGLVRGRPAVVSPLFGGNATLAWEPAPGVVAFVGYSGAAVDDQAVAALRRLAERTRPLSGRQWQAFAGQTVDQVNEPG